LDTLYIKRGEFGYESRKNKSIANSNDNSSGMDAEILEQGDIYFFYRPKKGAEEESGLSSTVNQ
jgi:hypothetical protein